MIIPNDIVNKLNELPIEKVAQELGIEVTAHKALCFIHVDHNPSLSFSIKKNLYYCFVCSKGGGPIKLVQEYHGCTFQEACVWLGDKFKIWWPSVKTYSFKRKEKQVAQPSIIVKEKEEIKKEIDREIGEWIIENTNLSDDARRFLFEERKYKPEIVSLLKITSLSDQKIAQEAEKVFGIERIKNSRLFWRTSGQLRLCFDAPCLLFPFYTVDGKLYSIQSRYLGNKPNVKRFRFPKDVKQGIFNAPILSEVSPRERLYISEGVTDCIALLSTGKKAVAFPGSGIHHEEDVLLLVNKSLYMYPDNDKAGNNLFEKLNKILEPYSNRITRLELKEGCKDYSVMYLQEQIG